MKIKNKLTKDKEMKKSVLALLGAITVVHCFAGSNNNMNNNNMMTVVSVQEVRNMPDDSPVIIRGYMLRQNGENSYVFQDDTGTINLEIDEEDWAGQTFAPTDFVEVWGEVDKNGMSVTEVDVTAIKKL